MTVKTVGLDLAKDVFQVHGISENGRVIFNKPIKRAKLLAFFQTLPSCTVGMEACGSGHHWARQFLKLGHEVRLMPAMYVKAYVKRGKSDAIDAEAICEAVTRPTMRFVAIKTEGNSKVSCSSTAPAIWLCGNELSSATCFAACWANLVS